MCIALYKPKGVIISEETLRRCFEINDDGAGYMYNLNNKLIIKKGFFTFASFYEEYLKDEEHQCVIHFRIKTHGIIDYDNCHPFPINNKLAFIHNGIISGFGNITHSDTYMFNEEVLKPMIKDYGQGIYHDKAFIKLVEEAIGFSKLVFLDSKGDYEIYNESNGEWFEDVWYSNTSYKKPAPIDYTRNPSYSGGMYGHNSHNTSGSGGSFDRDYGKNKVIVLPPPKDKKKYYISKSKYGVGNVDIHSGDWVRVNWDYNEVNKNDVGEVLHIFKDGFVVLRLADGSVIQKFPSCYIDFWDINTPSSDLRDNFEEFRN